MELNRREFGTAAGVSLSAALAGCSALEDDSEDVNGDENETDPDAEDDSAEDGPAENDSADADGNESETEDDEQELIEDESVSGTIILSDGASDRVAVVRDTFTWIDESPSDQCQVHVMLENTGDAELTVDMVARIYDEDGTELASSTETDVEGPDPSEDDAVYSFDLDDCEGTAEYEFEIATVDADEDDEPSESNEPDDDSDGSDEPNESDDASDEPDEPDDSLDEDDDDENESGGDDDDEQADDENEEDDADESEATNILRVIVQDGDGDPIDHATVNVEEGGLGDWSETQTVDGQGRAEFEVEPGEYAVTAAADDYPTLEETVGVDANLQYTVTLRQNP
jgi:hypothetical protein